MKSCKLLGYKYCMLSADNDDYMNTRFYEKKNSSNNNIMCPNVSVLNIVNIKRKTHRNRRQILRVKRNTDNPIVYLLGGPY